MPDIFDELEYVPEAPSAAAPAPAPVTVAPPTAEEPPINPQPWNMAVARRIADIPASALTAANRYGGYVAASPTVRAMRDAATRGYDFAADRIASDPRVRLLQTGARGVDTARAAARSIPALAYAGFERAIRPVAADVGRFVAASPPLIRRAAHYVNPLNTALGYPVKLAAGRAGEAVAEAVVPAVFAARDAASRVGGVVGAGLEREADYWRGLRPSPSPLPVEGPPVVPASPQSYPDAPANPNERVPWEVYRTSKMGLMMWTGKGWVSPTEFR